MGLVEVGRQKFAVQPQLLALFAGGQLFLAGGLLADGALIHIVHRFVQFLALGAQTLGAVLFGVVAFQHLAEGGPLPDLVAAAVLLRLEEGELHRLALGGGHAARTAARGVLRFQPLDGVQQAALAGLVQLAGGLLRGAEGAPGGFPADHRPHPRHRPAEGGGHRQVLLAGGRHDGGGAGGQEVGPGRLGRDGVSQARQQLPDLAVLKVHPLEGVDDSPVLDQHQIGVAAHQLGAQGVGDQIPHLVGAEEIKIDDPVPRLHPDGGQAAAGQVLAHQHAEGGRGLGVLEALAGQADPGRPAAGRQQQAVGVGAGAQGDDQLVPCGFKDFGDLGVGHDAAQFGRRQRQGSGIQCHKHPPL